MEPLSLIHILTETGLFYSTNADTNLIYAAMDKAESTEAFLKLFGEDTLAKVQADIGEGEDLNDYEAAAMFDVTASEGAKKLLNGKAVDVEVAPVSYTHLWLTSPAHSPRIPLPDTWRQFRRMEPAQVAKHLLWLVMIYGGSVLVLVILLWGRWAVQ